MEIDCSDEHSANAKSPRLEILESGSNVKFERFPHDRKQFLQIVSIEEGIQMDSSDEHISKADSPSVAILEPASNLTDTIEPQ
jgi:hypothetical protein